MSYSNLLSFSAGLLLVSVIGLTSCSGEQPEAAPVVKLLVEDKNFVAISFFDCNELTRVVFVSDLGNAETAKIEGPAQLLDIQLRLSNVAYERAYFVVNDRPCGFVVKEEDVL